MPGRPLDLWPVSSRFGVLLGVLLVAGVVLTWIGIAAGIHQLIRCGRAPPVRQERASRWGVLGDAEG